MITFHIYKDCRSRSLNRPILNIQTKLGTYYNDTIPFTKIGCMDVTPICSYGCSKCDHQNCNGNIGDTTCTFAYGVEKLSYEGLFVVPQNANAKYYRFKAFISETSRTIGSVNCCGYSAIHHNYIEFTPTIWSKSSPVFNFQHTYILPVGQYQKIDFSAIDSIDGDSLSYEFDYANSLSSGNGYSSPYKFNLPFDFVGFPVKNPNPNIPGSGLVLDSLTGYIYVTPKYQQSAIVVVKVKEWRKDSSGFMQNIGFVRRDINCIFMTSMSNKIPSITGKKEVYVCDLDTFKLDFKSVDKDSSDTLHVEVVNPLPGMIIKHSYDSGYNKILTHIDWKPTSNMARQQPYYLVLKVRDNSCPIIGENSFIVKIHVYDSSGALGFNVRSTCDDFIINPKNNYLNQLHWKIIDSSNQVLLADTIEQIKIRLSKPGSYPIQLITGEHSCKISYYDTLKVFPKTLKIDLGLDTTICTYKGFHLVFPIKPRINGLIGTKTRYDWYNIQSQFKFSIDSIETINYLVSSNYNVLWSCVVTDSIGCRATDTINVKILGNRYTPGSFQNIYNGCESDSVKITAPKWTNQTQYKWANGDTNAATMVYDSGYYMLQLSDNGCITSDSIKVVKFSNPKVLPMLDKWICNGDSVVLKSNTQADSLIWDQLYAQDSIFVKSSGLHLVRFLNKYKISNTEYICGASDSVYVYHHPLQGLDLGTNDSICSGDSLLLSANHAYTSYIWSNGVQSESFFTKNAGTY
ncbi:MAG: hypothetical protein HYZ42_06565, partial [Bacteroidetes bacterium]|nr:hypothetical protein [Bacteroidota bacterium]